MGLQATIRFASVLQHSDNRGYVASLLATPKFPKGKLHISPKRRPKFSSAALKRR